jgi:uronate dehydrogenase
LVQKAIETDIGFGIYYGVSNNTGRFWDISNAERDLGYIPQDNAALLRL